MKPYEKHIKYLIEITDNGINPVYIPETPYNESDYRLLSAMGFVRLEPAGDNTFYCVLKKPCISYFENKKKMQKIRWLDRLWGFLSGLAVGILSAIAANIFSR